MSALPWIVFGVFFVIDTIWKLVKDSTIADLKRRVEALEGRIHVE